MIDELLTTFRAGVADPDAATAKRVYAVATSATNRRRIGAFGLRPRFVIALATAVVVLVPTTVAFGGKLTGLFEGTPAPPDISTTFADFNQMPGADVRDGIAHKWPQADVSKAHGVIEVQTSDGPEDMWAAPNDQGGQCSFIDFADDPVGAHGPAGFGDCDQGPAPSGEEIDFGEVWTYEHPDLKTIYGSVYGDAATVRLSFDDGSTATLPIVEHLYLTSTAKDVHATSVTAFDSAGNQVAERALGPDHAATHG